METYVMFCFLILCSILFQQTVVQAATKGKPEGDKVCLRVIEHEGQFYKQSLDDGQLDLREKNSYVYIEIAFKRPMILLGWGIAGKKGMLQGTGTERRGVVTEYVMKFMTQKSDWVFINNSKTGNEVFRSRGNLAVPDLVSHVQLASPIMTMGLRLYPQLWEGVPFLRIRLYLCRPENVGHPSELNRPQPPKSDVSTKSKNTKESTSKKSSSNLTTNGKQSSNRSGRKSRHRDLNLINNDRHKSKSRVQSKDQLQSKDRLQSKDQLQSKDRLQSKDGLQSKDRKHSKDRLQTKSRKSKGPNSKDLHQSKDRPKSKDVLQSKDKLQSKYMFHPIGHKSNDLLQSKDNKSKGYKSKDRLQSKDHKSKNQPKSKGYKSKDRLQSKDHKSKNQPKSKGYKSKDRLQSKDHKSKNQPKSKGYKSKDRLKYKGRKSNRSKYRERLLARYRLKYKRRKSKGRKFRPGYLAKYRLKYKSRRAKGRKSKDRHHHKYNKSKDHHHHKHNKSKGHHQHKSKDRHQSKKHAAKTCKSKPKWRYTKTSAPPNDVFMATGDSIQAWRAMGGLHMEPFTFNIKAKNSHNMVIKKIYLQVSFKKLTKLFGFRIGGSSSPSKWGCVTKFAILYKIETKPNWSFYRDDFGAPRVFDMGKRDKESCSTQLTFSLPAPIITRAIRLYPERWANQPKLHINFLSCNLEGINCIKPLLRNGQLQRLQFGQMDHNLQARNSIYYITIELSKKRLTKVKAIRFLPGPKDNGISKFVLQYRDTHAKWSAIDDIDGEVMIFSGEDIVKKSEPITVFLQKSIKVKSLRLYPQAWEGISPIIQIDVLGCKLKKGDEL